jgi:hypothetical protein
MDFVHQWPVLINVVYNVVQMLFALVLLMVAFTATVAAVHQHLPSKPAIFNALQKPPALRQQMGAHTATMESAPLFPLFLLILLVAPVLKDVVCNVLLILFALGQQIPVCIVSMGYAPHNINFLNAVGNVVRTMIAQGLLANAPCVKLLLKCAYIIVSQVQPVLV